MTVDFRTVHHVHAFCMQHFEYVPDLLAFGETEHWCAPDELRAALAAQGRVLGDCDDFASLAVMVARQQGLLARFVFCHDETGTAHLVAEVEGWIVDNRQADAVRRDDLDYVWVCVSGDSPGDPWHVILTGAEHG